ncbi:MAG TPA: hypothetical protein VHB18_15505 [Mycobacteriales bacterium]|jgi:hypothetical protein|nr:hypothetical protein [Mycobacteriales bacterium]
MTDSGREPTRNGHKVVLAAAGFFVLLLAFVLILVFTIGVNNNGVKLPHSVATLSPTASAAPAGPPHGFFAITPPGVLGVPAGGTAYVDAAGTASARPPGLRAVAIGVTADDRRVYAAYPKRHCRSEIELLSYHAHWRHGVGLTRFDDVAVIPRRVAPVAMAISPDGTKLAFVASAGPASAGAVPASACSGARAVFLYDLTSHQTDLVQPVVSGQPVALAWEPDGRAVDVLTGGAVTVDRLRCLGCDRVPLAEVGDAQVLFWWHGHLSTVSGRSIREIGAAGLGATLGGDLPENVSTVSVDSTGTRLLVLADPQSTHYPGGIRSGAVYEWTAGKSIRITGEWVQPAW